MKLHHSSWSKTNLTLFKTNYLGKFTLVCSNWRNQQVYSLDFDYWCNGLVFHFFPHHLIEFLVKIFWCHHVFMTVELVTNFCFSQIAPEMFLKLIKKLRVHNKPHLKMIQLICFAWFLKLKVLFNNVYVVLQIFIKITKYL